ncbi:MAG: DUF3413 domain-containing protein [Gammaproteobacteria bacterium]|nr:MAG: DUF3413 domain-containing protein [Gammaproteobacteria bacterium]
MNVASRRQLLRWAGWFAAANAAVFAVAGLRFLLSYPGGADPLGIVYTVLAVVGHFSLLAALPVVLVVVPLALVTGARAWVSAVAVLLMALVLTLLVVDGNVFAEQRYHLTPLTAVLFEPATWVLVGIIAVTALAFEALLAGTVWRWVEAAPARGGRVLALVLGLAWIGSQGMHIWADALGYTPVTQLTRYLPAYFPIHAKRALARLGLVDAAAVERARLLRRAGAEGGGQLAYPLQPLRCAPGESPPNLLVVLIDALRPDAVHPGLTPNLVALAEQGTTFANHWSGGNSSRAGIFTLFFGLPASYLEAFYGVQQPPLLLQEMQRQGYQLGLFAAPGFSAPADIGRTVFAGVPGLPGERRDLDAIGRNLAVTDGWLAWLAAHDSTRPFFGFLYYDPPMGQMGADPGGPLPLGERFTASAEAATAWRQYRRAMQRVDGELGRVVGDLRARNLLDNTIIVVASDHGYEFDDNGLGYLGHASNFSPAQLRATLVLRWPGRTPATVFRHRSSHFDVPVTLLEDAFGCTSPPADYTVGRNLFAGQDWDWIIAGSYNSHAIVTPDRVIVTHPGGFVEVLGPDYRPVAGASIDPRVVEAALRDMRRFYR